MVVTARELKFRLGQYLAVAQAGQPVRISLRGRVVAELRPIGRASSDALRGLVAEGLATPGKGSLPMREPVPSQRKASDLIIAER
jgi:prevent-host-death family protein